MKHKWETQKQIEFSNIKANWILIHERIKQGKTARLYDWWEINQVKNVSKEKTDSDKEEADAQE